MAASPPRPPPPRPLTVGLLRSQRTAAELERLTGIDRTAISRRRDRLGIERVDRPWLAPVQDRLGREPDTVLAAAVGVSQHVIAAARRRLGIPKFPKPSRGIEELRSRLKRMSRAELRRYLARLDPIGRVIVQDRVIADRPATLAQIRERFGVTRQTVAGREVHVIVPD